jgi:hypothetical protein
MPTLLKMRGTVWQTIAPDAHSFIEGLRCARRRLFLEGFATANQYIEVVESVRNREAGERPYDEYLDEVLLETLTTGKAWYQPERDALPKALRSEYLDFLVDHVQKIRIKPAGSLIDPNAAILSRSNRNINAEIQGKKAVEAQVLWQRLLSTPFKGEMDKVSAKADLQIIASQCWPDENVEIIKEGDDLVIQRIAGNVSRLATLLDFPSVRKHGQVMISYSFRPHISLPVGIDALLAGGSFFYTGNQSVLMARYSMYVQLRLLSLLQEMTNRTDLPST